MRVFQYQDILKYFLITQLDDMESDAQFQKDAAPSGFFKIPSNTLTPIAQEKLSKSSASIA
jgi:hypothetical protein